jgi:Amt family ammonium transporter
MCYWAQLCFGLAGLASTQAVLVVTNLAAAAAAISFMLMDWIFKGKPSATGMAIGAVVGLVVITPASGYVGPMAAIIMGLVGGVISNLVANWRSGRTRIDDTLDVFACHGVGGIWGAIGTGIFASAAVGGASGLIEGNLAQFGAQLLAVGVVVPFSFFGSYALLKLVDKFSPLRVSPQAEDAGLDLSEHGEEAYQLD